MSPRCIFLSSESNSQNFAFRASLNFSSITAANCQQPHIVRTGETSSPQLFLHDHQVLVLLVICESTNSTMSEQKAANITQEAHTRFLRGVKLLGLLLAVLLRFGRLSASFGLPWLGFSELQSSCPTVGLFTPGLSQCVTGAVHANNFVVVERAISTTTDLPHFTVRSGSFHHKSASGARASLSAGAHYQQCFRHQANRSPKTLPRDAIYVNSSCCS